MTNTDNPNLEEEVNANYQTFGILPINNMLPDSSTDPAATWCEGLPFLTSYQQFETEQAQPRIQHLSNMDPAPYMPPAVFEALLQMIATPGSPNQQAYAPMQGQTDLNPALLDPQSNFQTLQPLPNTLNNPVLGEPATNEVLIDTAMEDIQVQSHGPLPTYDSLAQDNTQWNSESVQEHVQYTFTPDSLAQNAATVPWPINLPYKTDSNNSDTFMRFGEKANTTPPSSPEDHAPGTVIPTFAHKFDIITQEDAIAIVRRALEEHRPIFHGSPGHDTSCSKIVVSGYVYVAELSKGKRWIDQGTWTGSRKGYGKNPAMIYRQRKANTKRGKTFSNSINIDEQNCKQLIGLSAEDINIRTGMSLLEFTNRYIAGPKGCEMADPNGMVKRSFKVNIPSDDPSQPGDRSFMVFSYYKLKDLLKISPAS